MYRNHYKKSLAVAIILLFIGVAFAPSINANVSKNELVEITTEVCGIDGIKPNTVKLTKQESKEVEQLIDDIKSKLDKAETREETVEIFNEAIIELDKYGLLGGLSIEQAQRHVTSRYNQHISNQISNNNTNALCLIAGETSETNVIGLGSLLGAIWTAIRYAKMNVISSFLGSLRFFELIASHFPQIDNIIAKILLSRLFFPIISTFLFWVIPIKLGGIIEFGSVTSLFPQAPKYHPSEGWVNTFGLFGRRVYENPGYGQIFGVPSLDIFDIITTRYIGVIGFTGLSIGIPFTKKYFFLGTALWVNVGPDRP